jgi:hypothetical protein
LFPVRGNRPRLSSISGDYKVFYRQVLVNGAAERLCEQNHNRCVLLISGTSSFGVPVVSTDPNMGVSDGIDIGTTGGQFILNSVLHPGLLWEAWYANSTGVANCFVYEVIYEPLG